ncbi:hypothetical protein [Hoeflea olei]|nr:hypothetical protein [Hoeflea olei]
MKPVAVMFPAVALALSSCGGRPGGVQEVLKYDARSLAHVKMADDTYRLFEHPAGDRVMTTSSIGAAMGQGFIQGATLGVADVKTPEQRHEAAARRYLDLTGRQDCTIGNGYELVHTQYEFRFTCPEGVVVTRAPSVTEQMKIAPAGMQQPI